MTQQRSRSRREPLALDRVSRILQGGLVVSCQAPNGHPMDDPAVLASIAAAVVKAGAVAIRAEGPANIRAIRNAIATPIIGLWKVGRQPIHITPTRRHAEAVVSAGADLVAIDATTRLRPEGSGLRALIRSIHEDYQRLVVADVATLEEGEAAAASGADFVATTLSGYTDYSSDLDGPDIDLVGALVKRIHIPVIAEGRIRTPHDARMAFGAGAWSVVVGAAITSPSQITSWFLEGLRD